MEESFHRLNCTITNALQSILIPPVCYNKNVAHK